MCIRDRERRAALSLDALSDAGAAAELSDVERDLAGTEAEVERLALARVELDRRDAEARESAAISPCSQRRAVARRSAGAWHRCSPQRPAERKRT